MISSGLFLPSFVAVEGHNHVLPWLETLFLGDDKYMLEVAFCYPSQDIQICILLTICSLQLSNV